MQCASCQFENMPGVTVCGRCGAQLGLATATIDVHPPRASRRSKQLRRWFPWYGPVSRARNLLLDLRRRALPDLDFRYSAPGIFARMIVPGWPQIFVGQPARGRILLGVYLALLLLGIVFLGTVLGSILLGSALAVHAASVIDILWAATPERHTRISWMVVCLATVALVTYCPVVWAVGQYVAPRQMVADARPFAAGDVVLCNPSAYRWSEPTAGDVVLFRVTPRQVQGRTPGGYNAYYRIQGEHIDRVLARAGQSVEWDGRALRVDGQPSPWVPLNPERVPAGLQVTVPAGTFLVLPSAQPPDVPAYPADVWLGMGLVPRESILGRVFLRHQPLTRWWWIR